MIRFVLTGLFVLMVEDVYADGRLPKETPAPEKPVEGVKKPTPVTVESDLKERLIAYILQHPELPQQQDLLKQVLETPKGIENVLKTLPEKDRKELAG